MPLQTHRFKSQVLEGNPLGDPVERDLIVYVPPGYDAGKRYPTLLAIVGFTGTGASLFNADPLGESLDRRLDRLIASGQCPPCIVAAPDCFTRVGGNQYINSLGTGRYEDYLLQEVMPLVDSRYRTGRWGVFGKSSGGYGSIVLGMRHPDRFAALADHSGDACFELCYIPDFPAALDAFREAGGVKPWLDAFWKDENRHRGKFMKPLNVLGMAAHYSPGELPFDLETGEFKPEIWEKWRAWDPVNMVAAHAGALRKLRAIYVDCGTKDEFSLVWGARALVARLRGQGLTVRHEEFDDGHMSTAYRYDQSIPWLVRALGD
jgi:enterochelin esterase family protein